METQPIDALVQPESSRILEGFRKVIRPFVRLLLRNRIGFHACMRIVKEEYLHVANTDAAFLPLGRANQTQSNVTYLTGIRRRDVKTILESEQGPVETGALTEAVVLQAWTRDPIFLENGKPKVLPIRGKGATFATLVSKRGRGASYGPILDSLVSAGCVKILPGARAELVDHKFAPVLDNVARFEVGALSSMRLANTLAHNLEGREPPLFHKELWSTACEQQLVNAFQRASTALLMKHFDEIEEFLEDEFEDLPANSGHAWVGVGMYAFVEQNKSNQQR